VELTVILRLTQYRFFCITPYGVAGARRAGVRRWCHTFSVQSKSINPTSPELENITMSA